MTLTTKRLGELPELASLQGTDVVLVVRDGVAHRSTVAALLALAPADDAPPSTAVFMLAGQSNMVGRKGPIDPTLDATDPEILMLSGGELVVAADPLDHFDETADTVGPGLSFAKAYREANPQTRVVLVPAADGNTGFIQDNWRTGDPLYEAAVARVDQAMVLALADDPGAVLGGILWLQGEDEVQATVYGDQYAAMVRGLIRDLRADIAAAGPDTPFVLSGMSPDWYPGETTGPEVQAALRETPQVIHRTGFADSDAAPALGGPAGDPIHYIAESAREMGRRQYGALVAAQGNDRAAPSYTNPVPSGMEFYFDHAGLADGFPVEERTGRWGVKNQRVRPLLGVMDLTSATGSPYLELHRDGWTGLGSADWTLHAEFRSSSADNLAGIIGEYFFDGRRSWVLYLSGSTINFNTSSNGSAFETVLTVPINVSTMREVEVSRAGDTLTMRIDGAVVDTATLASGFTFFDANRWIEVGLYNTQGDRGLRGTIDKLWLRFD